MESAQGLITDNQIPSRAESYQEQGVSWPGGLSLNEAAAELVYLLPRMVGLAVTLAIAIQLFIAQSFYIPSSSMLPTLERDDCVVVPKLAYGLKVPFSEQRVFSWRNPARGEVVVFHRDDDPATGINEGETAMIKRVIGVAGDEVSIVGHAVLVNGEQISEPYARWSKGDEPTRLSFRVPRDRVFLLGDNRDVSYDSRFWNQPFVSVDKIVGPATAVYWPANRSVRLVE
jgi:signal peptidase I